MAYSLKLVTAADATMVDFHGTNGTDLGGLIVSLRDTAFDLTNPPETERVLFESSSPGGALAFRRHALVESSFMVNISATTQANLLTGIGKIGQYLQAAARESWALKWQPDGASEARYYDLVDADLPLLMTGEDGRGYFAYTRFEGRDIPITVIRQPYARGASISSDVNILKDGALLKVNAVANWALDSGADITGQPHDAAQEALQFDIATTGTRNFQQTTAVGTFAAGDVTTFQYRARAVSGSGARVRAVVRYQTSAAVDLGSEQASGQTVLTSEFQTIQVTTSAAPATTSRAKVMIRFENVDASSYRVQLKHAQAAKEATASLFREGTETASNNPTLASTTGRIIPVYVHGTAPTPAAIKITGDSGAQISSALVAKRSGRGILGGRIASHFYAHNEYYQDLASATLYNSTTTTDDSANGGNGTVAVTSTGGTFLNRRTRSLSSVTSEGLYDVYLRVRSLAASEHNLQLRWGLSDTDPVANSGEIINLNTTGLTTFPYLHINVGRVAIPANSTQISLEMWTDSVAGSSSLYLDYLFLVPVDEAAAIIAIPGASSETWIGDQLVTPTNPAGLTAGAVGGSNSLLLEDVSDAGGPEPNAGLPWPVAYHTVSFDVFMNSTCTGTFRVRNITDSTDAVTVSKSQSSGYGAYKTFTVNFISVTAKAYQPQVVLTAQTDGMIVIFDITHTAVPFIGSTESISTDSDLHTVKKLNASSAPVTDLTVHGAVPVWLDPGLNLLYYHFDDIPAAGYTRGNAVRDRAPTVRVTYKPRYLYA